MRSLGEGRIRAHYVWKRFDRRDRVDTLREAIPALARRIVRGRGGGAAGDPFWAVRELDLEVRAGEALGIIGPNGAGKSTVLKLLTGLLRPSRGTVEVTGRVGALIELASGFHPDLTGRENVYLQGAILGMRRREIAARFDQIVSFAGVEAFIDTPVKRYSSGMNARLGFAIAAHLEPDVLLIDEVLTVGDFEFQRRATERLRELIDRHIPVVIVSHQLDRVVDLCDRAILLSGGRVCASGSAVETVETYMRGVASDGGAAEWASPIDLHTVAELDDQSIVSGDTVVVRVEGRIVRPADVDQATIGLRVRPVSGGPSLFATNTLETGVSLPPSGSFSLSVSIDMNAPAGLYAIEAAVWHVDERRRWATGPMRTIRVEPAPGVHGVNFSPAISVETVP